MADWDDVMSNETFGINVLDMGAVGNGETDDSAAIQRALDSGEPLVTIPYGTYCIGKTLRVASNTRLVVHPLARLYMADGAGVDSDSFLLTNERDAVGFTIEGGIWDGNNPGNPRGPEKPGSYTGTLINFFEAQNFRLRNMTLRDPEAFFVRLGHVSNFTIEGITFEAPHVRPNHDGIHLGGYCEDGVIRHLRAYGPSVPNDDVLAFNADDCVTRVLNLGMDRGPIRRIQVDDVQVQRCHTLVRLLSVNAPIEDVRISNLSGGVNCHAINMDAARYCATPIFDPDDPAVANGVGAVSRVSIRDVHTWKASNNANPLIVLETASDDLLIADFVRDAALDVAPETPTLRARNLPDGELVIEGLKKAQVKGLQKASDCKKTQLSAMAGICEKTPLRASLKTTPGETIFMPFGGFKRLELDGK